MKYLIAKFTDTQYGYVKAYRIYDANTDQITDMPLNKLLEAMYNGLELRNARLTNDKRGLQGKNYALSLLPDITNDTRIKSKRYIALEHYVSQSLNIEYYLAVNSSGGTADLTYKEALNCLNVKNNHILCYTRTFK